MNKSKLFLPKPHHSASDWDINDPLWDIITHQFVSPPSSMWWHRDSSTYYYQLCKNPATLKLPQGRLITFLRTTYLGNFIRFAFRNTAPPGTANFDSGYFVHTLANDPYWGLREFLDGVYQRSWQTNHDTFPINTWIKYRLSWWITWDVLQVRLEHQVNGEWVQDGNDISVENPLFGDSDIQRCGMGGRIWSDTQTLYWDDTEIWEYP